MLNKKSDFPIFNNHINGKNLVYLDTGASAQKPQCVIDCLTGQLSHKYANIHRGLYKLSQDITQSYEQARSTLSTFIGASSEKELIFTRNTTESINLIASSWGRSNLKKGDEIILSEMEHHANIVPWYEIAREKGAVIKVIPVTDEGELDYDAYESLLSTRTKIVSVTHTSNALGTINNINKIKELINKINPEIVLCVDGSQAVVHSLINIQELGCDFYVFTGHKLYGPNGIGVLWGKEELLNAMPPYQGGGDMIVDVSFDNITYQNAPARFEAGTPAITEAIALAEAAKYLNDIGMDKIEQHEKELFNYVMPKLQNIDGLRFYGTSTNKAPIISFAADWAHHTDIGMILDQCGVAVRSGHHCCMPLMKRYGIEGTIRASIGLYNTKEDLDIFVEALNKAKRMLAA